MFHSSSELNFDLDCSSVNWLLYTFLICCRMLLHGPSFAWYKCKITHFQNIIVLQVWKLILGWFHKSQILSSSGWGWLVFVEVCNKMYRFFKSLFCQKGAKNTRVHFLLKALNCLLQTWSEKYNVFQRVYVKEDICTGSLSHRPNWWKNTDK